jgi:hypothetical protein
LIFHKKLQKKEEERKKNIKKQLVVVLHTILECAKCLASRPMHSTGQFFFNFLLASKEISPPTFENMVISSNPKCPNRTSCAIILLALF